MVPNDQIYFHIQALQFLKLWSCVVEVVDIVVVAITASVIVWGNHTGGRYLTFSFGAIAFSCVSIVIGLNVLGTLPWIVQQLPQLSIVHRDLYQIPNYLGIKLWILAFGQHITAIVGLALFLFFLFKNIRLPNSSEYPQASSAERKDTIFTTRS